MNTIVSTAIAQRHALHRLAELSNQEKLTSEFVQGFMQGCKPFAMHTHLGGHGLIAEFGNKDAQPVTLLRAELDALPIPETLAAPHAAEMNLVSHKCGHDGHMAILCGVAQYLRDHPVKKGRVALLFQPAEETGEGCAQVMKSAAFKKLKPQSCFALHNLPGFESGSLIIREKLFAAASLGLIIRLHGSTSHAAEPHNGNSPTRALATMLAQFPSVPHYSTGLFDAAQVTVIHARLGSEAFGTSPGNAEIMLTLRAESDALLDHLLESSLQFAHSTARSHTLKCSTEVTERFPATVNDGACAIRVEAAAKRAKLATVLTERPFPWSEDFGHMLKKYPGALFGIGAGVSHPALHHPAYDFPDEIIEPAIRIFTELLQDEHY